MKWPLKKIIDLAPRALPSNVLTKFPDVDKTTVKVCHRCWDQIKLKSIPELATVNNLYFEDFPDELSSLNWLEDIFIKIVRPCQAIFKS